MLQFSSVARTVEAGSGQIILDITGPVGTREILKALYGLVSARHAVPPEGTGEDALQTSRFEGNRALFRFESLRDLFQRTSPF